MQQMGTRASTNGARTANNASDGVVGVMSDRSNWNDLKDDSAKAVDENATIAGVRIPKFNNRVRREILIASSNF
jgi:hypothetical protein